MKARLNNGTIQLYSELPPTFKSTTGLVLSGYDTLSEEIHQADGFYDVITPEYDYYTQYLSPIFFDEDKKMFTYTVEQREIPIPRPVKSILTPLEFLNRFTDEEAINILSLSKTNSQVELWWVKYNKAQDIDLDDPQTISGVNYLESSGVIAAGRASIILIKEAV